MSNTTNAKPSHRIYSVQKKESDTKPIWTEIGAAWPHKDGKGFNLKFRASPFGESEVVLRIAKAKAGSAQ